jgi:hypothetical protein
VNILLGTLLLAYLLAFCAYICWDVHEECEFQLDDERRRNGEAMSATERAEESGSHGF